MSEILGLNESIAVNLALTALKTAVEGDDATVAQKSDADLIWILIAGFMVFFMHAGFTMLEAGSVRHQNAVNILFKNMGTISIGAIFYYLFGYGFAYGTDNADSDLAGYIGVGNFANKGLDNAGRNFMFFQLVFAATAATIVSGAVAGRIALSGYFIIVCWLTGFVYPVVSHAIWATGGWLSAFNFNDDLSVAYDTINDCGVMDYAGSGVVHMTGGVAAFWAALILGPRLGRWGEDKDLFVAHNVSIQALGTFILWFGWYGFNCGSTLAFDGPTASKCAVTTTLAAAASVCMSIPLGKLIYGHFDIGLSLNAALAGLVGITASCSIVTDGYAILIGALACLVYIASSKLMKIIGVDDPVDAISVHGSCGILGVIGAGLFQNEDEVANAYVKPFCDTGVQTSSQLIAVVFIIGWVTVTVAPLVLVLKLTKLLRVSPETEASGLDSSEHGATAFLDEDKA